jgi:hypothetical protein
VIELRQQTVAVMDISAASMMNMQRIQAYLDVYLANRGSGQANQLGDCARITGYLKVIHMPDAVVVQVESCQNDMMSGYATNQALTENRFGPLTSPDNIQLFCHFNSDLVRNNRSALH